MHLYVPCGLAGALVGWALVGSLGPLPARPLWVPLVPYDPGPCGSPWALMRRALIALLVYIYIY